MAQAWAVDWVPVEVIALQYPTPDPSAWVTSKTPDFSTATHLTVAESPGDPAVSIAYQQLPPSALKLAGAWRTLSRHGGGLQVLFHVGWRQRSDDSHPVWLSTNLTAAPADVGLPAKLEGTVRVQPLGRDFRLDSTFVARPGDIPVVLTETRRVAADDLHYLDHPLVGLLIQISLVEPPGDRQSPVVAPPAPPSRAVDAPKVPASDPHALPD